MKPKSTDLFTATPLGTVYRLEDGRDIQEFWIRGHPNVLVCRSHTLAPGDHWPYGRVTFCGRIMPIVGWMDDRPRPVPPEPEEVAKAEKNRRNAKKHYHRNKEKLVEKQCAARQTIQDRKERSPGFDRHGN